MKLKINFDLFNHKKLKDLETNQRALEAILLGLARVLAVKPETLAMVALNRKDNQTYIMDMIKSRLVKKEAK